MPAVAPAPAAMEQPQTADDFVYNLGTGHLFLQRDGYPFQKVDERFKRHLAQFMDCLSPNGDEKPLRLETFAAAVGAGMLHHHLFEPLVHPVIETAFLAVAAVVALDKVDDAAKPYLSPLVPLAHLRARRQHDGDLFTTRAIKEDVHRIVEKKLREFF